MEKKYFFALLLVAASSVANAAIEHHNLSINTCRSLPSGDIQIVGSSETDNQLRNIVFPAASFKEKVLDRHFSLCLTALTTGMKLRLDYLECVGTSCTPTAASSFNLYK